MTRMLIRFLMTSLFLFSLSQAAEVNVSSMAALQSAINSASSGDVIILANGTYLNSTLTIGKSNITVRAAALGGVFLNGTQSIDITGNYVTFSGFQFTDGDIGSAYVIEVYGSHNNLTQLNFNGYYAKKYIHIRGGTQHNEISYCNIENKPVAAVVGCTIQVTTSPTVVGYHAIKYCSFKNFPGPGGDYGNEPIRIGLSTEMTNVSRTVVEHCYFENVGLGDSESISVKSTENICRYNTFSNNPEGMLVLRHGYKSVVYGNFFINGSGGIRIKEGDSHYVYNNYFETGTADALTLQYVAEYPLQNINIVHNTFVNMGAIDLGGTGPTTVTFANNIFSKSSGSIFSNANGGTTWTGNMYQGTLGVTIPSGMTNRDPLLVTNGDSYKGLSALSPAIDAASASYPVILDIANIDDDPSLLLDISGQGRSATAGLKDVGCDEYSTGGTTYRPLTLSDVGPSYLGGPEVPLPVQMTSLNATSTRTGAAISWSTATETNCAGFAVERRTITNQQSQIANWTEVGYVRGNGTSNVSHEYTFSDEAVAPGRVAYRIKQMDNDGSFSYYGNAEVEIAMAAKQLSLGNYPNPFNPTTSVEFTVPTDGRAVVKVYNVVGQVVATLFDGVAEAGRYYRASFDGMKFSSGMYLYSLETASGRMVKRMAMLK